MNKKITLAVVFFLLAITGFAQNYPGKNVELLLNREVKVLPDEVYKKNGYPEFYSSEKMGDGDVYKGKLKTKYEELVNKTFKVTEVKPIIKYGKQNHILVLTSPELKKPIYYFYEPIEALFPFEVIGGIELPKEPKTDICSGKVKEVPSPDKDGSSYLSNPIDGISFAKTVIKGESNFYISVIINSKQPISDKKGLILFLDNDKKIEKPEQQINVNRLSDGTYVFSALALLTPADRKLLLFNEIKAAMLYIYDSRTTRGRDLIDNFVCVSNR